jgi:dihydroorotate dehydrogenase electron transfer subunit
MVEAADAKIKHLCYSRASMPFDVEARIVSHVALNPDHFLLTLDAPPIARAARPGQFVMLQTHPSRDPLLRRPMSLARVLGSPPRRLDILYKVVGEGTLQLSRRPRGARLRTLGPLGRGFRLPPAAAHRAPRQRRDGRGPTAPRDVLVSGGIGIAIFPFLETALRRLGARPLLVFGARRRRDLVGMPLFPRRLETRFATEDGSRGVRGFVTRLLEPLLAQEPKPRLYVCGPTPMLRAIGDLAVAAGASCQLALEAQMPCGIGVCLGCVVARRPSQAAAAGAGPAPAFVRVCTEGPVFEAGEVQP